MSACVKRLSAILSLALALALSLFAAQQAALADDGALMGGDPVGLTTPSETFGGCDWSVVDDAGDGYLRLVISPSASPEPGYEAGQLPSNSNGDDDFWPWNDCAGSITSVEIKGKVSLEDTADYMFCECSSMTYADLSGLDTSAVVFMHGMFNGCSSLTSLDLSGWDTEKVRDMREMFSGCSNLASLDLSGWNTGSVTDMREMFSGCSSLTSLDAISGWDTGNVVNMGEMFRGCSSLASLDGISGWSTEEVSNMGQMFRGCSSLTSLDLSGWNTEKVEYMDGMFSGCSQLASLDLSGWDTGNVADMREMFSGCTSVEALAIGASTALAAMPPSYVNGRSDWYSTSLRRWFTEEEILANRLGAADTYTKGTSIAGAEVSGIADKVYDGKAQAQSPTVKLGPKTLAKGVDYKVSYSGNVNAGTAKVTIAGTGEYIGTISRTFKIAKAGQSISASDASRTYGAAAFNLGARLAAGDGKLSYSSSNAKVATVDGSGNVTIKGAGTAKFTVTAAATANYKAASRAVTVTVGKAANPLKLAKATRTVKAKNVEKKNIVVRGAKLVKAGQGTMTYSIKPIAKKYKKFKKYVGINKKTGKIAIKKGCPVGTIKVTVKATAKGNENYKSATRNAVVTIKVK